jgi:PII-like signaling protein
MELPRDAMLLRIFVQESDVHEGEPLFRKVVLKARQMKLAGATVLRGPMGFGRSSHLHTRSILGHSMGLPMVVEIVDAEEKIQEFLVAAEEIIGPGLITLERVQAIFYKGEFPEQRRK